MNFCICVKRWQSGDLVASPFPVSPYDWQALLFKKCITMQLKINVVLASKIVVVVCSKTMLFSLCHVISISTGQWISLLMLWCNILWWYCQTVLFEKLPPVCRGAHRCGEGQLFCLAMLYLMDKFLMPEAITGSHVCELPAPCASFFQVVMSLGIYWTASVAKKLYGII